MKPTLKTAVQAVGRALADLPVPGMIIGGVAVIARGVPRLTRDVDVTVAGGTLDLADLVDRLRAHDLVPRVDDAVAFASANQVLLLRHTPSGVDVDLSIAWLPFEMDALASSEPLDIAGTRLRVARAEALYGAHLDLSRVRRIVAEFSEAMEEPERPAGLEHLLRRAGLA